MKEDYMKYGADDLVIDDLTQKTNRFNKPLWFRVGKSGTGKIVLFGFAIVEAESGDSVAFIQKAFLEAMNNKKPKYILIDESTAEISGI